MLCLCLCATSSQWGGIRFFYGRSKCKKRSILEDALPTRELCFVYGDDLMFLPMCIYTLNEIMGVFTPGNLIVHLLWSGPNRMYVICI